MYFIFHSIFHIIWLCQVLIDFFLCLLKLLSELHEVREENKLLKKRVELYENTSSSSSIQSELDSKASFKSSLENYKPRELPELAPLETPDFDFTGFS